MKKIVTSLQKLASGRVVLILIILTMAVFSLMLLYTIPKVESFAPGMTLFDMSPSGYSYQQAISLLESLGEVGRNVYLSQQLPADFVYPGLFAISYSLLLTWLFAKSFEPNSKIFFLVLVPVLGGLFDYLENIGIVLMINAFPDISQELVGVVSTFTLLKSAFTIGFYVLLLVGIFSFIIRRIKSQNVNKGATH